MLKRTFLKVAALTALSLAAPQIAAADALAEIEKSGTIRVAVPQDFPPFGSVGPDMTPQGYDIDVAKLIAEKIGVELELVPVTSANRIPYLQTQKVDLVISSLAKVDGIIAAAKADGTLNAIAEKWLKASLPGDL